MGYKVKRRAAGPAAATHLLKLLHGEHLFGELQDQIVIHCAGKHL